MIILRLVSAAAIIQPLITQSTTQSAKIFGCEYFSSDRDAADGWVHQVDLRIVERADSMWTVDGGQEPPAIATPFPVQFGRVGRSLGLHWKSTTGNHKTAYISFSDVKLPDGMQVFWFTFDRPSPWRAPGYLCQSMDAR